MIHHIISVLQKGSRERLQCGAGISADTHELLGETVNLSKTRLSVTSPNDSSEIEQEVKRRMKEESKRQTVSETEILNPHWNLLTDASRGGMPGRHSLKVTGSAIESKIDNAIWLEGGSCGFQSRSKEQGIIPLLLL